VGAVAAAGGVPADAAARVASAAVALTVRPRDSPAAGRSP
jgi:hypothetical protein